jgi:phosphatidylinositol dimannoside acyltransferase
LARRDRQRDLSGRREPFRLVPRRLADSWGRRRAVVLYRAGGIVACGLPRTLTIWVARLGGVVCAVTLSKRRAVLSSNLRRVLGPSAGDRELKKSARQGFISYGWYWAESLRLEATTPEELEACVSFEGLEHLERALEQGRGVVFAVPHLGNFDVGAARMAAIGYPLTVVVEPVEPPELFEWFCRLRQRGGMRTVPLGPTVTSTVIEVLRANGLVALVCDRDLGGRGVEVELFGAPTTLPGGPATLALRTGAALLPAAAYDEPGGRHRVVIRPPVDTSRQGSVERDVGRITRGLACELERIIRVAPEQWHVFQPCWPRTEPLVEAYHLVSR